jgi:hypothetical protein
VPRSIVDEARLRFSKRDYLKFVSRAMARELVRIAREEYVDEAEKIRPVDDARSRTNDRDSHVVTRTVVLDTGALLAFKRRSYAMTVFVKATLATDAWIRIPVGCIAESW